MPPQVPVAVEPVLEDYLRLVESKLPGLLSGLYLHGSLALGAFNLHSSDIDFISVVSRRCAECDVEILRSIHVEVAKKYPRWEMSGSYLQWEDLGRSKEEITQAPCYHGGQMKAADHHDIGAVTWWVLKNRGIALVGPPPDDLPFSVDWEELMLPKPVLS